MKSSSQASILSFFETRTSNNVIKDGSSLQDEKKRGRDPFNSEAETLVIKKGPRVQTNPPVFTNETQVEVEFPKNVKLDPEEHREKKRLLGRLNFEGERDETGLVTKTGEQKWSDANRWASEIQDEQGRSPDEEGYDPTTLYIPQEAFNALSPFQKQFWSLKRKHYDVVLFFKKGKFYELYDCDADLGHRILGLNYTAGGRVEMRCVGVPETTFARYASKLVDSGFRVGRVEQVETTNAAAQRRKSSDSSDSKSAVCQRSLVRIMTKGSLTCEELGGDPNAHYLICLHYSPTSGKIGFCYLDVAAGYGTVGELKHSLCLDELESILFSIQPVEMLVMDCQFEGAFCELLKQVFHFMWTFLAMTPKLRFFTSTSNCQLVYLRSPSSCAPLEERNLPLHLINFLKRHHASQIAVLGCLDYLKSLCIPEEALRLDSIVIWDKCCGDSVVGGDLKDKINFSEVERTSRLTLVGSALLNLDVLPSGVNKMGKHSLLSFVDHTVTSGGKRLLRQWITSPLASARPILERFDAVDILLKKEPEARAIEQIRKYLSVLPDIERQIIKVQNWAHCSYDVVMFDDSEKRKALEFSKLLKGLEGAIDLMNRVLPSMLFPDFETFVAPLPSFSADIFDEAHNILDEISNEFPGLENNSELKIPTETAYFDDGNLPQDSLESIDQRLDCILQKYRQTIDPSIRWFHRFRESHQLEIPRELIEKAGIPDDFILMSQTMDKQRFWTPEIKQLVKMKNDLLESRTASEYNNFRKILLKFDTFASVFKTIARIISEVDVLMSLAQTSLSSSGVMCRPEIIFSDRPYLCAEELRHPCLADMGDLYTSGSSKSFIPVSLTLGGDRETSFVIRGPNMGGKSTLLREICLAVILAQCGCYVPAKKFQLTLIDQIFTRMGATDSISRGQSTFLLEVEETASILNGATRSSLVIDVVIDELGRGTSTYDGYAIAKGVLNDISSRIGCLCLFSTHYHNLIHEQLSDNVAFYEMQAEVDEERKDVTFLYSLKEASDIDVSSRGIYCAKISGYGFHSLYFHCSLIFSS
eukprot:jgi/Galph1/3335/GphlegSOOS_G1960.1